MARWIVVPSLVLTRLTLRVLMADPDRQTPASPSGVVSVTLGIVMVTISQVAPALNDHPL